MSGPICSSSAFHLRLHGLHEGTVSLWTVIGVLAGYQLYGSTCSSSTPGSARQYVQGGFPRMSLMVARRPDNRGRDEAGIDLLWVPGRLVQPRGDGAGEDEGDDLKQAPEAEYPNGGALGRPQAGIQKPRPENAADRLLPDLHHQLRREVGDGQ